MGEAVKYLLGAGGLAFFAAVGGAIKWIYDGVSRREDKVETQTRRWQRETVDRATWEAKQHDYWRDYAARLEYVITSHPALGPDKLPEKRPYPRRPRTTDDEDADTKAVER
jgi:hypothetical protein